MAEEKPEPKPEAPPEAPPAEPQAPPPEAPKPEEAPRPTRAKKGVRKAPSEASRLRSTSSTAPRSSGPGGRREPPALKEPEEKGEKAPPEKRVKRRGPEPPSARGDLERFIAHRLRERYPETRRLSWEELQRRARRIVEESPELLESYTRNRRAGEQEAMARVYLAADLIAGRIEAEEETTK